MADIDIQEKKGSVWPWLVGLLALVLVIWIAFETLAEDDDELAVSTPAEEVYPADAAAAAPTAPAMPSEVTSFEQQCASADGVTGEMARSHEFAVSCVRALTAALESVIRRDQVAGTDLSAQFEEFRAKADALASNPDSPEHSAALAAVMTGASSLINDIEEARMNGSDALERRAGRVEAAAESFDADGVLLEQRDAIASFFREASSALRALATQEAVR